MASEVVEDVEPQGVQGLLGLQVQARQLAREQRHRDEGEPADDVLGRACVVTAELRRLVEGLG